MPRQFAFRVVSVAIAFLTAITALEVALHIHYYFSTRQWLFRDNSNFKVPYVKAVGDRRQYALRENFKDDMQSINALGFRGAIPPHNEDPLICVLGDSVPYGAGVKDDETFPHHLQALLDKSGYRARVLNAGVPSYNLRQSLDRWRFDVLPRWTCTVIILNAANDVSLLDYFGEQWSPDLTWAELRFGARASRWSSIAYYALAANTAVRYRGSNTANEPNQFAILERELLGGLAGARARRIPVVLMPINPCYYSNVSLSHPSNREPCANYGDYGVVGEKWQHLIVAVNDILKKTTSQGDISFIDAIVAFDTKFKREGKYIDFIHFSSNGARDVAGLLMEHMAQKGLLSRGTSASP